MDEPSSSEKQSETWWEGLERRIKLIRSAISGPPESQIVEDLMWNLYDHYKLLRQDEGDALDTLSGKKHCKLLAVLSWLGGWRPTMAVRLVSSALRAHVLHTDCVLSPCQISAIKLLDDLLIKKERNLTDELTALQTLCQAKFDSDGQFNEFPEIIAEGLKEMLQGADELRFNTLNEFMNILNPIQAAQCSIDAYDLLCAIKRVGLRNPVQRRRTS